MKRSEKEKKKIELFFNIWFVFLIDFFLIKKICTCVLTCSNEPQLKMFKMCVCVQNDLSFLIYAKKHSTYLS